MKRIGPKPTWADYAGWASLWCEEGLNQNVIAARIGYKSKAHISLGIRKFALRFAGGTGRAMAVRALSNYRSITRENTNEHSQHGVPCK